MTKINLATVPPCTQRGHPLSPCHPAMANQGPGPRWRAMVESLQQVLMEILAGEAYRHRLSAHLRMDVGLPEK